MSHNLKVAPLVAVILACISGASADILIDTLPVGNPGNAGEWSGTGTNQARRCGAVDYEYNIGKYEVTTAQYTQFLNAVAASDPYELYNVLMWDHEKACKIERTGSPGSYTYSVADDWANRPVNLVNYWDSCRFANWLHNGQPTGPQGPGTTETGAYRLQGYTGEDGQWIERNAGWKWAVTSEDEWHKAAYHKNDGVTGNYFDYPTSSDSVPSNVVTNPDPGNNANYYDRDGTGTGGFSIGSPYYRTEVGEFENSLSPYGAFDMGGNVGEWVETIREEPDFFDGRSTRGGGFWSSDFQLAAAFRFGYNKPSFHGTSTGFRVVEVPEPASVTLLAFGAAFLFRKPRR